VDEDILPDAPQSVRSGMPAASGVKKGDLRLRVNLPDRLNEQFSVGLSPAGVIVQSRDTVAEGDDADLLFPRGEDFTDAVERRRLRMERCGEQQGVWEVFPFEASLSILSGL
jgi:hypothetical protein